jgi:hypothetical protein
MYYDTASGYLIQLYHGEFWYNGSDESEPFYSSHGLTYSTDFGNTWHKLGQVVSPQTTRTSDCQAEVGAGTLLVVGSYLYDYYTDTSTGCSSPYLAVARATISSVIAAAEAGTPFTSGPGTLFMKYTGSGTWNGDGVTNLASPASGGGASVQITASSDGGILLEPNVRYNSYLNKYLLVYANGLNTSNSIEAQWSTDGVTWTDTQVLISGADLAYYPSLLNTSGGDPQTLGQNFSVFYVSPLEYPGENLYSTALSVVSRPPPPVLAQPVVN